jgi:hypothetical protein
MAKLTLSLVLLAGLVAVSLAATKKCRMCTGVKDSDCHKNPDKTSECTTTNDGYCSVVFVKDVSYVRGCSSSLCAAIGNDDAGTKCCKDKDYCNSASNMRMPISVSLSLALVAAILYRQ